MSDKINVQGIAIVEGLSRNKIMYKAEELDKFTNTLVGRPILKDHQNITDNTVGKVTSAESIDKGKKVIYKGWIKNDGTNVIEKIKDGLLQVSIGAMSDKLVKETEESDFVIAKGLTALELSLTPVPGIPSTTIFPMKNESMQFNNDEEIAKMIEKYEAIISHSPKEKNISEGDIITHKQKEVFMESNEVKSVETAKVDETLALKEELAKTQKLIEGMKEEQRQTAINSYKEKASAKSIPVKDCSALSLETIRALTEMVDSVPAKVNEEKKVIAQPASVDVKEAKKSAVNFDGYVCESSELGGFAFYKSY